MCVDKVCKTGGTFDFCGCDDVADCGGTAVGHSCQKTSARCICTSVGTPPEVCQPGFTCSGQTCVCDENADCGHGGTCNKATGRCTCGDAGVCGVGKRCAGEDLCG